MGVHAATVIVLHTTIWIPLVYATMHIYYSVEFPLSGARSPSIIQAPTDVHTFENSSFTLHCRANHYAESLRWEKDGSAVVGTVGSGRISIQGDGRLSSSLTVREARREDSGVYYCLVESEAGRTDASAVVTVTGALLTCDGECIRNCKINICL